MNTDKYTYLIYKKYLDGLSQAESDVLQEWLDLSEENREIQKRVLLSMQELDDYKPEFKVNSKDAYQSMKVKMDAMDAKMPAKSVSIPYWKWLGGVAAIGILLLGTFWFMNSPAERSYITQKGEQHLIELSDGTKVWLNEHTIFTYPEKFNGDRKVKLEGEAFFDVAKSTRHDFEIKTFHSTVSVLGTSFNVRAYTNELNTTVAVKTGKVLFKENLTGDKTLLIADQVATLNNNTQKIESIPNENLNAFAWQDHMLDFKGIPLQTLVEKLEKHFKIQITIGNDAIKNCPFSMTKQKADLEQILNNIKRLFKTSIEKQEGKYIIKGGNC